MAEMNLPTMIETGGFGGMGAGLGGLIGGLVLGSIWGGNGWGGFGGGGRAMQAGDQTVAAVNAANMNISAQGYENRIQAQAIANQLQNQHADLKATIIEQGCQDRETMRQIADQAVRDKLNECQNELAAQRAQNNLTAQLQNQTLYLISQLKTTTTPAAGA